MGTCFAYKYMSLFICSRTFVKPVPNSVWSQFASYHCARVLLRPKDSTRDEPVARRRRAVSRNSDMKQSRPSISDGREGQYGQGWSGASRRDHPGASGLGGTAWKREIPVLWEQTQPRAQGVSSELRKLSLEDFTDKFERPVTQRVTKDPKEERTYEMVFGVSPCLLALTQGRRKAYKLFVKAGEASHRSSVVQVCEEAHRRGVQIQRVSKKDLDKISPGRVHQGMCLQASPLAYVTEEMAFVSSKKKNTTPLWLVLAGIQDPMNLGAVLRSAYFLGVDGVASCLQNSCPLTPVVSKASSGAMEVMDVYGYKNLEGMLKLKAAEGWQVVGTVGAEVEEPRIPVIPCSDFRMTKPTLLVMGGEGEGLSPELLCHCDTLVTIPAHRGLHPGIESLNVSVATGILLHTLLSSRTAGI